MECDSEGTYSMGGGEGSEVNVINETLANKC